MVDTVTVTEPAGFPQTFTTLDLPGFTNLVSVSWDQPDASAGLNQFTNIVLTTGAVPEPSTLILLGLGLPLVLACGRPRQEATGVSRRIRDSSPDPGRVS